MLPPFRETLAVNLTSDPFGEYREGLEPRYADLRHLGSGGNGSVYSAVDVARGERVALKLIPRAPWGDQLPTDLLNGGLPGLTDATALARLGGAAGHAPLLTDVFHTPTHFAVGMDLVDQDAGFASLETLMDDLRTDGHRLTERGAIMIFGNVVAALGECRDRGLLFHSDVKPLNIMINVNTFHVVLVDFGAAKPLEEYGMAYVSSYLSTTTYSPPEYNSKMEYTSDTLEAYSLGVTLYQMLHNGDLPYVNRPFCLRDFAGAREGHFTVLQLRRDISDDVRNILVGMLSLRPEMRIRFDM